MAGHLVLAASAISPAFQALLSGIGTVLAFIYRYIPNYGVAIIFLTLAIRVLLLPLVRKQIRSMQAMQALQPKVKELQKKYKGNRQKINEEMMKLYQDHGYNPLSGCLPILAQFPVLIALYAVLLFPKGLTHIPHSNANPIVGQSQDSRLYVDIIHQHTKFLGMNLVCSAHEAGTSAGLPKDTLDKYPDLKQGPGKLDCGKGGAVRIPYYVLLALMIGTTFYQQRQMQRASPAGTTQQQQMLTYVMPLLFAYIGFNFPVGLVMYWTTTNGVQIVQQYFIMARRAREPLEILPKARSRGDGMRGRIAGRLAGMQKQQSTSEKTRSQAPKQGLRGSPPSSGRTRGQPLPRGGSSAGGKGSRAGGSAGAKAAQGGGQQRAGGAGASGATRGPKPQGQGGARDARNRKKRRKR